jgi:hypothetical protein
MGVQVVELNVRVRVVVTAENATDAELAHAIIRDAESVQGAAAGLIERAGHGEGREREAGWVDESRPMWVVGVCRCDVADGAGMAVVA